MAVNRWEKMGARAKHYRYNGMERNDELGLDLAPFRSYDPAIGRWMQIDTRAEKYVVMSPYNGMGNNPILYSDPMVDSLSVTFSGQDARNAFYMLINDGLEGQFSLHVDENSGRATLNAIEGKGDIDALSKHGLAFYNRLQEVMTGKDETAVTAVYGDSNVLTGDYDNSLIDMADIMQFNRDVTQLGGTAMGKLVHELVEQYEGQDGIGIVSRFAFKKDHAKAISAENSVNHSVRTDIGYGVQEYRRTGSVVTTTINLWHDRTWRSLWMTSKRATIKVANK